MYSKIVRFIRDVYKTEEFIPLHEPRFIGNEKQYLNECIDSTFVSSVGKFVDKFEALTAEYTGSKYAIVCVNGTEALHLSLKLAGVNSGDEVITQPLTFIATANAISYTGAIPVFVDVDKDTMGLGPVALKNFLEEFGVIRNDGFCYNKSTGRRISACVPMHTFGHPVRIDELIKVCNSYNIKLIEDAAESLGSKFNNKHTGTFGFIGTLSYNGNKTITTGGGGMILTNDEATAKLAKHLTTQAKVPHPWAFVHDQIGYNYRLPNINAALGCAQMEQIQFFISQKRKLASLYADFFRNTDIQFFVEPNGGESNYWLNAVVLNDIKERDQFLTYTNENKVMTRPIWQLMNRLEMFKGCQTGPLDNSEWLADRIVNIPSSVLIK